LRRQWVSTGDCPGGLAFASKCWLRGRVRCGAGWVAEVPLCRQPNRVWDAMPLHGGPLLGALVEVGAGGVAAHGSRARCAPAVVPACCSDWREAWNPGWLGERPADSYGRAPRASFREWMTLLPSRSPTGTAGPVVKNGRLVLVVLATLRPQGEAELSMRYRSGTARPALSAPMPLAC
jgi:hypothetical protein